MEFVNYVFAAVKDDAAVKAVFDHFRNLTICALMLAAAQYLLSKPEHFQPPELSVPVGAVMMLTAGFLIFANAMHGLSKANAIKQPTARFLAFWAVNLTGPMAIGVFMALRPFQA